MSVIRAFIAIELQPAIQLHLEKISRELQSRAKTRALRWVAIQNIHLTIKFLGEVSSPNLDLLTQGIKREAAKYSPFEINVGGLGVFPTLRRPRVIWIGVEAPRGLFALQKGIETETLHLGYPPEDREFSPHLTLARMSKNASPDEIRQASEVLVDYKVSSLGSFNVNQICLFKSDLKPGGAVYTPLFKTSLYTDTLPANV